LFSVSFASVFKDKQFTTDDNSDFIDPYITFDAKLSKALTEKFTAYAEIRNIFNNRNNDSEYYLSPGRLITIGAKFKF
jgi:outer membrane receptor protein involved in Fe transport